MCNISILARRLILAHMYFVMLNFSFEFHTVLQDFYNQKFFMLIFLDLSRYIRYLCFLLTKTVLELKLSASDAACCISIQVCLTHCVVRSSLDSNSKREAISRSVSLSHELLHVVNVMLVTPFRLLPVMISLIFLAFTRTASCMRTHEYVGLKHFPMENGLR